MWKSNKNLVVSTAQNIVAVWIEKTESPCHVEAELTCTAQVEKATMLCQDEKINTILCLFSLFKAKPECTWLGCKVR